MTEILRMLTPKSPAGNDAHDLLVSDPAARQRIDEAITRAVRMPVDKPLSKANMKRTLSAVDYRELMAHKLPERECILGGWLMTQSLNMIHGWRGTGKSHASLGISFAVATGTQFLNWSALKPRNTFLVDGELPARMVQDRLKAIERATGRAPEPGRLIISTPDLLNRAAPDLGILEDQCELDDIIEDRGVELIVLDNLSALVRSGAAENDAESWVQISSWALQHRAAGRSVVFIHHSGKGGAQRGTSRREDLLDVTIGLKRPPDYSPDEGARFEVHFEKARHLWGDDVAPFEAMLTTGPDGEQVWTRKSLDNNIDDRLIELAQLEGMSLADIGREMSLDKSNVSRRLAKLREQGRVPDKRSAPKRNDQRNKEIF